MKTGRCLLVLTCLLCVQSARGNVVGYINFNFLTGDNLFANALSAGGNSLSEVFAPNQDPIDPYHPLYPNGTTITLWDPAANTWGQSATFMVNNGIGSWSAELTLSPGTGAKLNAPGDFVKTFVGEVVGGVDLPLPPPLSGPSGRYLLGTVVPISGYLDRVFPYAVGRGPREGEAVTVMNPATKEFTTSTFTGGAWDLNQTLGLSQAAFFDIIQVPEPSIAALGLLGLALLRWRKR